MKEKHQIGTNCDGNSHNSNENETNCSYCLSNSVHPRLARGEQYPCGFKPYRCDLCLYSTTTKGKHGFRRHPPIRRPSRSDQN